MSGFPAVLLCSPNPPPSQTGALWLVGFCLSTSAPPSSKPKGAAQGFACCTPHGALTLVARVAWGHRLGGKISAKNLMPAITNPNTKQLSFRSSTTGHRQEVEAEEVVGVLLRRMWFNRRGGAAGAAAVASGLLLQPRPRSSS